MSQDQQASVYLGRPCYHGFSQYFPCTTRLWTSHRFSPAVVDSMAAAITRVSSLFKAKQIVLIGYSGGGTLAMLLAERFSNILGVITIAANLDINAWTNHHGYPSLSGSLNPDLRPLLSERVWQLHLAGLLDENVPVSLISAFVKKQHSARLLVFDKYDHHCCWEEIWPSILALGAGF
jgi:dienelactone hydrolase